jgi:hypothetical protein
MGIGKVTDRDSESVLKDFFAANDLLPHLRFASAGEVAVGQAVGADLVPRSQPFPNLTNIHEALGNLSVADFPFVSTTDFSGYEELDCPEAVATHVRHGVLKDIAASIIKCNDNTPVGITFRHLSGKIVKRSRDEARSTEGLHLTGKTIGTYKKKRLTDPERSGCNTMVSEDRHPPGIESSLGSTEENSGEEEGGQGMNHALLGLGGMRVAIVL